MRAYNIQHEDNHWRRNPVFTVCRMGSFRDTNTNLHNIFRSLSSSSIYHRGSFSCFIEIKRAAIKACDDRASHQGLVLRLSRGPLRTSTARTRLLSLVPVFVGKACRDAEERRRSHKAHDPASGYWSAAVTEPLNLSSTTAAGGFPVHEVA